VLKPAEAERQRIETLAEAEKQAADHRSRRPCVGHSRAGRSGSGNHLQEGRSRSQGHEPEGRGVPGIQPGGDYRQADHRLAGGGESAGGRRWPNVDKITIVSTGNGETAGMSKITGDMTKIAAQVPALFETLSGMPFSELFAKVRTIGTRRRSRTIRLRRRHRDFG